MRYARSVLVALACLGIGGTPGDAPEGSENLARIREAGRVLVPLHERKRPPQPGDWLARFHESGQTFDEYLDLEPPPNRPGKAWTTLYIQPLGPFDDDQRRLLELTSDMLGRFYGLPVKTLEPIGLEVLSDKARRNNPTTGKPQIHSLAVLDLLKPRRPSDALAVLCLTTSDLYPQESWNFVFGQASLRERVGVWSVARLGDPSKEFATCRRRTLAIALHETGHMFGIPHCTAYECGMNGSNSRGESDRAPLPFCPECEMKVWWNVGLEPKSRYRRLLEFAEAQGMLAEARAWRASLLALEAEQSKNP
jgi:archaemetzincin